jgi:ABC-2 type transport system permease protein
MNTTIIHIRREFWEHRSLWIAPAVWVGIITLAFAWLIFGVIPNVVDHQGMLVGPDQHTLAQMSEADRREVETAIAQAREHHHEPSREQKETFFAFSYLASTALVTIFASIVVFFYLIDCLYAERRDRSILFWKSLPISDSRVVVSKLAVALVVVPLGAILLAGAMQLLISFMVWLRFHGTPLGAHVPDWSLLSWFKSLIVSLVLGLGGVLWYAPIAGYLLLVSSWARKNVFLWAVLPPVSLMALEGFFQHSAHVAQFIAWRFTGFVQLLHLDPSALNVGMRNKEEDIPHVTDVLAQLDMSGMFLNTEVWVGVAVAAALVFAAIRLRRYRDDT